MESTIKCRVWGIEQKIIEHRTFHFFGIIRATEAIRPPMAYTNKQ